jgi:YxiJ-like protein
MEETKLRSLAGALGSLLQADMSEPFPYEDCRKVAALSGIRAEDLIPDLDLYFSELAGYCSWNGRILRWEPAKVKDVRERISLAFFEKYAKYQVLETFISESETPHLLRKLALHEEMRERLAAILDQLPTS